MTDETTQTPKHGLELPAPGYDDGDPTWGELLNQALEDIEAELKLSGAIADAPAANEVPDNTWYHATDQNLIYRSDGSQWNVIAGSGTASNPVPEQHVNDLQVESVAVERAISTDLSDHNPHPRRSFEQSSALSIGPHPGASNPALTGSDVSDLSNPQYVADPFILYENGTYYLFFEVVHDDDGDGTNDEDIAYATSPDGLTWTYESVALNKSYHLAHPSIFKRSGTWYLIPSTGGNSVRLFTADSFPDSWSEADSFNPGVDTGDVVPFEWGGTWYALIRDNTNSQTILYYSDTLTGGNWSEHPSSPVHTSTSSQYPMGRPIVRQDYIDTFYQDVADSPADKVRCFRITELSETTFSDAEVATSPVIEADLGPSWKSNGMHHVDALLPFAGGTDVVAVDGKDSNQNWSIGIYTTTDRAPVSTRAYLENFHSINNTTFEKVQYDAISHDVGQHFDTTNHTFIAPESGYYDLTAAVTIGGFAGSDCRMAVRFVDGSGNVLALNYQHPAVDDRVTADVSTVSWLDEGEAVHVEVWQDSGGSADVKDFEPQTYICASREW